MVSIVIFARLFSACARWFEKVKYMRRQGLGRRNRRNSRNNGHQIPVSTIRKGTQPAEIRLAGGGGAGCGKHGDGADALSVWRQVETDPAVDWNQVAYAGGQFAAVGNAGAVMVSAAGEKMVEIRDAAPLPAPTVKSTPSIAPARNSPVR